MSAHNLRQGPLALLLGQLLGSYAAVDHKNEQSYSNAMHVGSTRLVVSSSSSSLPSEPDQIRSAGSISYLWPSRASIWLYQRAAWGYSLGLGAFSRAE